MVSIDSILALITHLMLVFFVHVACTYVQHKSIIMVTTRVVNRQLQTHQNEGKKKKAFKGCTTNSNCIEN